MMELDRDYFTEKLSLVLRDIEHYSPTELATELARLSATANPDAITADRDARIANLVQNCELYAAEMAEAKNAGFMYASELFDAYKNLKAQLDALEKQDPVWWHHVDKFERDIFMNMPFGLPDEHPLYAAAKPAEVPAGMRLDAKRYRYLLGYYLDRSYFPRYPKIGLNWDMDGMDEFIDKAITEAAHGITDKAAKENV